MDLDVIWLSFLTSLEQSASILEAKRMTYAGIPFLYITTKNVQVSRSELERTISLCAGRVMKGKQLHSKTQFVRNEASLYVFKHRFLVPQRKMFCCGNGCIDCIRLLPPSQKKAILSKIRIAFFRRKIDVMSSRSCRRFRSLLHRKTRRKDCPSAP